MPSIGVVVPNFNDARHLPRALDSVFRQADGPDEIVVVDDHSHDDSVAVIRRLLDGRPRTRLVENAKNLGVYGAIHEGLARIESDYVLFLAANDFVLPGIFARARRCIAAAPRPGLWSALTWIVDADDRPLRLHPSPVVALRDAYLPPETCLRLARRLGNWFTGTTLIFRREALEQTGRFDDTFMGMADLVAALIVSCREGAAYSPAPLAAIREHAGSYSGKTLSDPAALEAMVMRMGEKGRRDAPALFTAGFIDRTARRLRWTALRRSEGVTPRVLLAFAVLRPFDLLPTLWHRVLGWLWVRARARWTPP
jgi:hypothetical protein